MAKKVLLGCLILCSLLRMAFILRAAPPAVPNVGSQDAVYVTQTGKTLIYGKSCLFMGFSPVSTSATAPNAQTSWNWYDAASVAGATTIKGYGVPVPNSPTASGLNYPITLFSINGVYCANGLVYEDVAGTTIYGHALYIPLQ